MIVRIAGWAAVVLSVLILLVFTGIRLVSMAASPAPAARFDARYVEHPWVALLHIVPGMLFLALAPLQLIARIRQRHLGLHRRLGWALAGCAALSGVSALLAGFRLPAFGGFITQAATVLFGAVFLFSLARAIGHIRRREVQRHREWMIRVYALAMGVASIRIFVALLTGLADLRFEKAFGPSFWLGFGVNLLVAEAWINYTRQPGHAAARRSIPQLR